MINNQRVENFSYLFPELTDKQYLVLQMFTYGSAPKQLASQMGISQATVNQHMSAVKKKLNCPTTSDLRYVFLTRIMGVVALQSVNYREVNTNSDAHIPSNLEGNLVA